MDASNYCVRPIRVFLVDGHVVLRDALQALIDAQPDLVVVGGASTVADAMRLARELAPDVVMLDLRLPDGDGIQLARELGPLSPPPRVLVLTGYAIPQYLRAAQRAGAAGFVPKGTAMSAVLEALRIVAHGGLFFDPNVSLMASGMRNEAIACELRISKRTVAVHVSTILGKLGAGSRTEAVTAAAQLGLMSP
jgi:DNA-binding NarL/FixJ family response regulator